MFNCQALDKAKYPPSLAHNDAIHSYEKAMHIVLEQNVGQSEPAPHRRSPNIRTMQDGQTRLAHRKHFFIVLPSHSQPRWLAMYKPSMCSSLPS